MQTTSDLYKILLRNPSHSKEIKIEIGEQEVRQNDILYCKVSGALFDTQSMGIGGAVCKQMDLQFYRKNVVLDRAGSIRLYLRLVYGDTVSEWIPKGEFFVDSRAYDRGSGKMTIQAFDAMIKANPRWLLDYSGETDFPMAMSSAVANIALRIGVPVDSRTALGNYALEYPNDDTMRKVLSQIAVANAGNWVITDEGKLLLVKISDFPSESSLLVDNRDGFNLLFGEVRLIV